MESIFALAPLITLVAGALILLLLEVFIRSENKNYIAYLSIIFLLVCGYFCVKSWNMEYSYFNGDLFLGNMSVFLFLLLALLTILVILISMKYAELHNSNYGEYYPLLLIALSGMFIMVSSGDLLIIFLGLEVLSMSSYALAALKRNDLKSSEAALKYFLLGSFASAFLVYGMALLYGASNATDISAIMVSLQTDANVGIMALVGLGFVIIGFGFKVAVVPFHMWTPDVYQGAPTPITAFFSIGPKIAGFVVLMRIMFPYWENAFNSQFIYNSLWVMAVLTMVIGNLVALRQTNIKRLLAYSSIAHAGYLLVAIIAGDGSGLLYYFTVYLFMNIGAFSVLIAMSRKDKEYHDLEDYAGIGFTYPWIGASFSIFLLSLAGFPPTGGFLAKFYIFSAAVKEGHISLVIIAVLASLISVFYYLRIIIYMYMKEPSRDVAINTNNPALFLVLFLCLYGVLQLGIFPGNVLIIIKNAIAALPAAFGIPVL